MRVQVVHALEGGVSFDDLNDWAKRSNSSIFGGTITPESSISDMQNANMISDDQESSCGTSEYKSKPPSNSQEKEKGKVRFQI